MCGLLKRLREHGLNKRIARPDKYYLTKLGRMTVWNAELNPDGNASQAAQRVCES